MEPEEDPKPKVEDNKPEITRQLESIPKNPLVERQDDWLRFLHQRYSERFNKDGDGIWTVTSIFVPLSLAGLASIREGNFLSTFLLGMGSIVLINFWFNSTEKYRIFQGKSQEVVQAIEQIIGLDMKIIPLRGSGIGFRIQRGRRYVQKLVIATWIVAIVLIFIKCVVEAKPAFQSGTLQEDSAKIGKSLLGIKDEQPKEKNGGVVIQADIVNP